MASRPQFFRLRQRFARPKIADVSAEVHRQLALLRLERRVRPGQSVAITAGSRGIANIATIVTAAADHFRSLGASPFIVAAMGSHAGGTAEGQRRMLESFGITAERCGCEIRSSMETVIVGHAPEGFPVYFDRHAFEADHVLVCGRIKPHTDFVGDVQSGLMKMMLIGLGKHDGAKIYHRAIQDYSFGQIVRSVAGLVLRTCPIVAGLAIVENGYEETATIEAILPESLEARETELLRLAKQLLPRLPFERLDLLLIDAIGKNISGTGMDTNVIGRKFNDHEALADEWPKIRRIAVRGLTEATHGNATGLGIAEFCSTRLIQQIDFSAFRMNCLTSGHVSAGMLPLDYATDREMIDTALTTIGLTEAANAKIAWISNTLELVEFECSASLLPLVAGRDDLEVLTPLRELPFDKHGNLPAEGVHALSLAKQGPLTAGHRTV